MNTRRHVERKRRRKLRKAVWVEDKGQTQSESNTKKGKRPLGGKQQGLSVVGRRKVAMGHRGRETLTPAGSPLPFPYTATPASPGPAPASVWTAVDTRPSPRLPWHTMSFSHHHHPPKLLSHHYSHTGMLGCVYIGTHAHIHPEWSSLRLFSPKKP